MRAMPPGDARLTAATAVLVGHQEPIRDRLPLLTLLTLLTVPRDWIGLCQQCQLCHAIEEAQQVAYLRGSALPTAQCRWGMRHARGHPEFRARGL